MAQQLEITFPRPLASVTTDRPQQADAALTRAAQIQAQQQIDAELAQLRVARLALVQATAEFQSLQDQFCSQAESQLLDLSLEIARKVLMQEVNSSRHEVDPIVKEALNRLPGRIDAAVHLHPDDLARCEMARGAQDSPDAGGLEFVPDASVGRGECLVRTARGTVESSIDGHLSEISQALKGSE